MTTATQLRSDIIEGLKLGESTYGSTILSASLLRNVRTANAAKLRAADDYFSEAAYQVGIDQAAWDRYLVGADLAMMRA